MEAEELPAQWGQAEPFPLENGTLSGCAASSPLALLPIMAVNPAKANLRKICETSAQSGDHGL